MSDKMETAEQNNTEIMPMISEVQVASEDTSAILRVTLDDAGNDVDYYYFLISKMEVEDPTAKYVMSYGIIQSDCTYHAENLNAVTKYFYYVVAEDHNGQLSAVFDGEFTTAPRQDGDGDPTIISINRGSRRVNPFLPENSAEYPVSNLMKNS